jgi:RHS repeat-associated protein
MTRRLLRHAVIVTVMVAGLVGSAAVAWAQNPPETIEYYATDALGSVRVVFTPTGQVVGRSDYLPFGDTLNQSGALPRQRFTGQERDGEAGLDYFNARSLQMRTGRMNRPDPLFGDVLANPQHWNRYAYVGNNPLVFVDPSGNQAAAPPLVFRSGVEVCLSCLAPGWAGVHPDVQSSVFDTLFHLNFGFESGDGGSVSVGASTDGRGGGGAGQTPPIPPPPKLPIGDPIKPVDAEQVKREVAGPGCQMQEMQVTGYDDGNPRGADNTPVGPGMMATANTNPKPYPFGTGIQILGTDGTVKHSGVIHDTGNGWLPKYHNISPEQLLDVWMPSYRQAMAVGNKWYLVRLCSPR